MGDTAWFYGALLLLDRVLDEHWQDNVGLGVGHCAPWRRRQRHQMGHRVRADHRHGGGYASPGEQVTVVVGIDPGGEEAMSVVLALPDALRGVLPPAA